MNLKKKFRIIRKRCRSRSTTSLKNNNKRRIGLRISLNYIKDNMKNVHLLGAKPNNTINKFSNSKIKYKNSKIKT